MPKRYFNAGETKKYLFIKTTIFRSVKKRRGEQQQWETLRNLRVENGQSEPLKTDFFEPLKKAIQTVL
jgi:hypothetical protein